MTEGRKNAAVLGASEEGGTGWAIAQALAARGFAVTAGARRQAGIDKLAGEIGGKAVACDATVEADVARFCEAAAEDGGIDCAVLVAGAGVVGLIDDIPADTFARSMKLNFESAYLFVRHAARAMNDGGSIVLMSSIAGTNPWHGYFSYGCAKAALQMLVKYAAIEYGPRGIRVNAVCPGPISTPAAGHLLDHPRAGPIVAAEVPLGRCARPEEVAEAVAWLGTAPGWITGETIHTDGGMFLRRPPIVADIKAAMAGG
ncbi:SDR family oxidoreductase [Sphingomonas sp. ID0503]|jgi:3-oxoacyl-[acyl-carrier protein] reductase|uniref:SDR family oxidoreductase n=1 Tax=Sphingomonas sp. ID0503 TaxID=3399691 RepID=UPI003AFA28AF